MRKETVTYTDYNGNERTEDFWFNLTKAECTELQWSVKGGLDAFINKIIATEDSPTLLKLWKELLFKAYGEKDIDGRRFRKSEELSKAFSETEAYSELYMKFLTDAKAGADFVNGIIPNVDQTTPAPIKQIN